MTVRLILFGAPQIEHGGEAAALPFERRGQLLAFLALKRTWVGRAELATLLWPDQQTKLAYANLRKTLFRLQSSSSAPALESHGSAMRFDCDTDVHAFETALRERRLADALPLRRGELLSGFDDDGNEAWSSWLGFERDRLRAAWRDAALAHLAEDIDPAAAIELSARVLEADPLDEAALRAHMAWLARSGQSARARQAWREFIARLDAELGLAPSVELKALHDSLGATVPPAPSAPAEADEGFVGRSIELRRIAELLAQDDCRLLTLIGPGGVGKTRLAQRALQELAAGYADGTAFVALDDATSAGEVGGRMARELGVALRGSGAPLDQVIEFLRGRQMLIALDNFEQLASEGALLERLLAACARLKIIVTTRVRLASALAWLFPLEGLPCPEPEDQDRIEAFDAARLFINSARRVEPALLPEVEAESIVEICRRVEGLPLAIELAAAWTRVLSCDAIAAELRRGTELLRAVDTAHPARHASFELVFEQSWKLLNPHERDALAKLALFRGGFTAEAARAVAGARLPVLGALVDKSLLRKDGARLSMHPLVQQLASEHVDDDAWPAAERAHAQYFHRLLEQSRRAAENGDRDALRLVDGDLENCRSAWRWAVAHEAGDVIAGSAPTLFHYFDNRGLVEEGLALLNGAVDSKSARADPRLQALLLGAVAHLQYRLDRYADAEASATRGLAAARSVHDSRAQAQCLQVLGTCRLRLGRLAEAGHFLEQAVQHAVAADDLRKAAAILYNRAVVEKAMGRYEESMRLTLESLAHQQRLGDVAGQALCLNNIGLLHMGRGEFDAARAQFTAALDICDRHALAGTRGFVLANLTDLALRTGDDAAAERYGARALEAAQAAGNRTVDCWLSFLFVHAAVRRGNLDHARATLAAALKMAIDIGQPPLLIDGVQAFAEILAAQGEDACARRLLRFAADHAATSAPDRDRLRARLAQLGDGATEGIGFTLDELARRIVAETDVHHAPLIAELRQCPSA